MADIDWSYVVALTGVLLGGGGLAALWRTRGQNRVDDRTQLTLEQQAFRQSMAEQLAALRQQAGEHEKRNDVLETESRSQGKQIVALETRNAYQADQIKEQADQIANLRQQNATQAAQIAALIEEKAGAVQKLQIEMAKNDFLTRENNELRHEVIRLQNKLPARLERALRPSDESPV